MRSVWRITRAKNTHSQYVILIAFPLQQCSAKVPHYYIYNYTVCIVTVLPHLYITVLTVLGCLLCRQSRFRDISACERARARVCVCVCVCVCVPMYVLPAGTHVKFRKATLTSPISKRSSTIFSQRGFTQFAVLYKSQPHVRQGSLHIPDNVQVFPVHS